MSRHIIVGEDTELPVFLPRPQWLSTSALTLEERIVYTLIYERAYSRSLHNPDCYVDKNKHLFVIYTNESLAHDAPMSLYKVKKAKKGLVVQGYIDIVPIKGSRNVRIYPLYPSDALTYVYHNSKNKETTKAQSFDVEDFFCAAVKKTEEEI